MNTPNVIKFRWIYFNAGILNITLIIYLAIYFGGMIVFLYKHENLQPMEEFYLGNWICFGFILLFLVPPAIATMWSTFILTAEGVVEHKGYFWGLFHGKSHIPWSEFRSWDTNYAYAPAERKAFPQINLYYKQEGCIRVNQKNKRLFYNDRPLKWDAFSKHLVALLNEVNLPRATPKSERSKRNLWVLFIVVAAALILLLLVAYGVLTMIAQPVVFFVALFIVLIMTALGFTLRGGNRWK